MSHQQKASSAARKAGQRDGQYMHVTKVEIRASTSIGNQGGRGEKQLVSAGRTLVPRPNTSGGSVPRSRPATAPKKIPLEDDSENEGGGAPSGGGAGGNFNIIGGKRGAKAMNMQLSVDNSSQGIVKMQGSALVRPSSAVAARPDSSKSRPPSHKATKPPTAASMASTEGSRPGTSQWTDENLGVKEDLSAIDSDDEWDTKPGSAALPPRHPGNVRGLEIGKVGGKFDFSTMQDLGNGEEQQREQTAGKVLDRSSGRALRSTGIPSDLHHTLRSYTGEKFEKKKTTEVQDMMISRQKYGFRSTALHLQVALAERLKLALDPETKFDIYREMFTEVIRVDASYSELLNNIKTAYDDRLALVPVGDEDHVSFAAYQLAQQEAERQSEHAQEAREECERLREMAVDASAARAFLAAKVPQDDGDDQGFDGGANSPRTDRELALEAKIRQLEEQVEELKEQLGDEQGERERVEDVLSRLSAEQAKHLNLSALGYQPTGETPRDTARSAASGYDDHPTHRPEDHPPPRPDSVPALSEDAWNLVQVKRKEEEEEEATWEAQDAQQEQGDYEEGEYGEEGDEEDQLMREHYERQIRQLQEEHGLDEDEAVALLMRSQQGEGGYAHGEEEEQEEEEDSARLARPHSRLEDSARLARPHSRLEGGGYRGGEEEEEDEESEEYEEGASCSQSDRTLSQSDVGSSFASDGESDGALTGRKSNPPQSARMDAVEEEASAESPPHPQGEPRIFCG